MKILKERYPPPSQRRFRGECRCGTQVEASGQEVFRLVDRDSPSGAHYVHCPRCDNQYLWVAGEVTFDEEPA